jgi:hypothetical protein
MRPLRLFKDEQGSTSLTVVIAIVVALALVATCLQWYWVNSSSTDIQTMADLGALAAADASAKTVMLIQMLDALLLTANLFGLLLHCVVVVAGVLTVVSSPVGGAGAAAFFEKAVEFDKNYCEKRKTFARDAHQFASALNEATPYLAMAQSYRVVAENSASLEGFNQAQYVAVALPFPFKGEVELTGFPPEEEELLDTATEANKDNATSACAIERLEAEVEQGLDDCFRLDRYKPAGTQKAYWDPASAFGDFKRGYADIARRTPTAPATPVPIENNARNRAALAQNYADEYRRLGSAWKTRVNNDIGSATAGSDRYSARDITVSDYTRAELNQQVYLLEHTAGDRRAYHAKPNCFGLAGATKPLQTVTLAAVMGESDHPPCVLCGPPHWRALETRQTELTEFARAWNAEAAALRAYQKAKEALEAEQAQVKEQTDEALGDIVQHAGSFLLGGRLNYTPSGARGFLCVVATVNEREVPAFTLPALTASTEAKLGRQIALSGAKLMYAKTASTLPSALAAVKESAGTAGGGLGGVTHELLGSTEGAGFVVTLWGTCLDLYTKGSSGLESTLQGLPWGLDTVMSTSLHTLSTQAQISAPDLRRPQPTLVDTAQIGDPAQGGIEGGASSALRTAKDVYQRSFGANTTGLKAGISNALDEMMAQCSDQVDRLTSLRILGVTVPLPFAATIKQLCSQAITALRSKQRQLLAALGDASL